MRLATLLDGLEVSCEGFDPGAIDIASVTERSGEVGPGSLFIARRGERVDATGFIPEAVRAGASAVLSDAGCGGAVAGWPVARASDLARATAVVAERFHGEPSSALAVAGVTGTNGKTTISHAIRHILNAERRTCGLIGTVETDDGQISAPSSLTTPFAVDLSRGLSRMVGAGCTRAVIEASSHALAQGRVAAIRFGVGVFTNLSGDHQDFHGSMEAYADAKARLFGMVGEGGVAIVNADDPWWERVAGATRARLVRCSAGGARTGDLDAIVEVLGSSLDGLELSLRGPFGAMRVRAPVVGAHNAMNLLQAACAAHAMGANAAQIGAGLESFGGVRGRSERVCEAPAVFVDFAHTDGALRAAISGLRRGMGPGQRLIIVFGCGGDRDRSKRPRMGRAARAGDLAVLTSDNPRTEDPLRIIEDVRGGMEPGWPVLVIPDRREAIFAAIDRAAAGDVVLIAGKGHEREQILPDGRGGTRRIEFDDAAVAREAVERWRRSFEACGMEHA